MSINRLSHRHIKESPDYGRPKMPTVESNKSLFLLKARVSMVISLHLAQEQFFPTVMQ